MFHLKKSMIAHFPASYNSNSYLGNYSRSRLFECLMEAVSTTVSLHIVIVFAVENYYCKWRFLCPVRIFLFLRKNEVILCFRNIIYKATISKKVLI